MAAVAFASARPHAPQASMAAVTAVRTVRQDGTPAPEARGLWRACVPSVQPVDGVQALVLRAATATAPATAATTALLARRARPQSTALQAGTRLGVDTETLTARAPVRLDTGVVRRPRAPPRTSAALGGTVTVDKRRRSAQEAAPRATTVQRDRLLQRRTSAGMRPDTVPQARVATAMSPAVTTALPRATPPTLGRDKFSVASVTTAAEECATCAPLVGTVTLPVSHPPAATEAALQASSALLGRPRRWRRRAAATRRTRLLGSAQQAPLRAALFVLGTTRHLSMLQSRSAPAKPRAVSSTIVRTASVSTASRSLVAVLTSRTPRPSTRTPKTRLSPL